MWVFTVLFNFSYVYCAYHQRQSMLENTLFCEKNAHFKNRLFR